MSNFQPDSDLGARQVHVVVKLTIQPENYDTAKSIIDRLVDATRREEGCIYYVFSRLDEGDNAYGLFEAWVNSAALDGHNQTEHFTSLVPELAKVASIEVLKRAIDYNEPSISLSKVDQTLETQIRLAVLVTIIPDDSSEGTFIEHAAALASASRAESGCYQYTFAKVQGQTANEFVFIELWRDENALAAHREADHCKALIPLLDTCSRVDAFFKATSSFLSK
jgi:quinol monooxygenase YgiN